MSRSEAVAQTFCRFTVCLQRDCVIPKLAKLAFLSDDYCASQAAICVPALAKPSPSNKEVDDNTSALVQGLLAKSKASKDRYTKERLNDYYRRNFKVCSKTCLQFCPAACLAHDGVHCKGCRVHIDIEVHGGHCAELAQGNYLMPRVTCALIFDYNILSVSGLFQL